MNLHKLKLNLTLEVLNSDSTGSKDNLPLRKVLSSHQELGRLVGVELRRKFKLDSLHTLKAYALRFENAIVDVSYMSNSATRQRTLQSLDLHN